jgi:hypothetical protein
MDEGIGPGDPGDLAYRNSSGGEYGLAGGEGGVPKPRGRSIGWYRELLPKPSFHRISAILGDSVRAAAFEN